MYMEIPNKYCMLLFPIRVLAVVLTFGKKRLKRKFLSMPSGSVGIFSRKSTEEAARHIMTSIETERLVAA